MKISSRTPVEVVEPQDFTPFERNPLVIGWHLVAVDNRVEPNPTPTKKEDLKGLEVRKLMPKFTVVHNADTGENIEPFTHSRQEFVVGYFKTGEDGMPEEVNGQRFWGEDGRGCQAIHFLSATRYIQDGEFSDLDTTDIYGAVVRARFEPQLYSRARGSKNVYFSQIPEFLGDFSTTPDPKMMLEDTELLQRALLLYNMYKGETQVISKAGGVPQELNEDAVRKLFEDGVFVDDLYTSELYEVKNGQNVWRAKNTISRFMQLSEADVLDHSQNLMKDTDVFGNPCAIFDADGVIDWQ